MKNKCLTFLASALLMFSFSALKADINVGVSIMTGNLDTDGSETEKVDLNTGNDINKKELSESFIGGSIFIEKVLDNGLALGVDYVPVDIDIGDGKRVDTAAVTENDSGTRTASASLEDLITIYANVPFGASGYYGLIGYHTVDVTTTETLNASKYGDVDLNGYQLGFGKKGDNYKLEAFYSDFDDISITSTGGSAKHVISADADAMGIKLSYFY